MLLCFNIVVTYTVLLLYMYYSCGILYLLLLLLFCIAVAVLKKLSCTFCCKLLLHFLSITIAVLMLLYNVQYSILYFLPTDEVGQFFFIQIVHCKCTVYTAHCTLVYSLPDCCCYCC